MTAEPPAEATIPEPVATDPSTGGPLVARPLGAVDPTVVPDPSGPPKATISPAVATLVDQLLDEIGVDRDRRLARELLTSACGMLAGRPATIDLKIAASTVHEMGDAYAMFANYRDVQKVSVFGSARTVSNDPLWAAAKRVAQRLSEAGWMVITGAGPGIMQAAMEGAGRDMSIGVSIRLPFEQSANPVIHGDTKYVSMKYFFTRKLMLVKESRGFVCLPGGFGTLDETFELLTLTQTGKGVPVPIVFLDTPGDPYWEQVHDFVEQQLVARGLVAAADTKLYLVTDDADAAVDEIVRFYANYDSLRYVGDLLILRMQQSITDEQLAQLNDRFGHLCKSGTITRLDPLEPERRERDRLDLHRIGFTFAKHGFGELRALIDALNSFVS
jgi:uncharacterized protein (TIGR00730 family)